VIFKLDDIGLTRKTCLNTNTDKKGLGTLTKVEKNK